MKKIVFLLVAVLFVISGNAQMIKVYKNGDNTPVAVFENDINNKYKIILEERSEVEHEYVDLGLRVKWAKYNIGAVEENEPGLFFAWGDIHGYSAGENHNFSWDTYIHCEGSEKKLTKYCTNSYNGKVDDKMKLEDEDDAAKVLWGGKWRMPTVEDFEELRGKCTWSKITGGFKVTSNVPGCTDKYIILPAPGYCEGKSYYSKGYYGHYWTSELSVQTYRAKDLWWENTSTFKRGSISNVSDRYLGYAIRAVME